MKKSANGYYKFYNKAGLSCRIKCEMTGPGRIMIKFKTTDDLNWMYYSPNRTFKCCLDASNYILKNLENKGMVFKIYSQKRLVS